MTAVDLTGLVSALRLMCATFAESHPMFVFSICVSKLIDDSSGRISFRFSQVLTKIYLRNSTPCFIFYYYCAPGHYAMMMS